MASLEDLQRIAALGDGKGLTKDQKALRQVDTFNKLSAMLRDPNFSTIYEQADPDTQMILRSMYEINRASKGQNQVPQNSSNGHEEAEGIQADSSMKKLLRRDPKIRNNILVVYNHIMQSAFDRYSDFTVPHLARIFGISPNRLREWEEQRKLIKRTGTLADGHHPTFDLAEAIKIGYLSTVGNHIPPKICSELRRFITEFLAEEAQKAEVTPLGR